MGKRNSHCSYCGAAFADTAPWPRTCAACASVSYVNPLPVAVLLVPVDRGLLAVRRSIEPQQGQLALPGGYVNLGESWQEAAVRELWEETQVRIDPAEVRDFRVLSAPDGTLLVFGAAARRTAGDLPPFAPTDETTERVVVTGPTEMAFPLHTRVVSEFFGAKRSSP